MRFLVPCLLVGCAAQPSDPPTTSTTSMIAAIEARSDVVLASKHRSLLGEHTRYRRLAADGTVIADVELAIHANAGQAARIVDPHPAPYRLVGSRVVDEATALAKARALVTGTIVAETIEKVALPERDGDVVRAGYRAVVETREPAHGWEIWIDGTGAARIRRDRYQFADGGGMVYDPNPVMQTGDLALVDNNDATSTALDAARIAVTLPRLDGSGVLRGQYADVHPRQINQRANEANNIFEYKRDDARFEEVNAYYHLDAAQAALQVAGFTDANNRVQVASVNSTTQDNSFYSSQNKAIEYGSGGVDDAEDADVVVHEYGHAVLDNIVPDWGADGESAAMGEGFGDLLAAMVLPTDAVHVPMIDRACVAAWDATAYDNRTPACLRRVDGTKHYPEAADGEVHDDGEIWSAALWKLYTTLDKPTVFKLVVETFFNLSPSASFGQYADALIAADTAMNAGANVDAIKKAMWDRGLLRVPAPEGVLASPMTMATDVGTPAGPLGNNVDDKVTIMQPGATAIRVHFDAFDMESDAQCLDQHCDSVYVFDGTGTLYGILGGTQADTMGPIVPGDTVILRYVTDGSVASMGFHVDRYDFSGATPSTPEADVVGGDDAGTDPDPTQPGKDKRDSGGCCDAGQLDGGGVLALVAFAQLVRRRRKVA